jgi:small-conductance mechanosensitive channel
MVEDRNPPRPLVRGAPVQRIGGVVLTFAAPIGFGGAGYRLELQGAEAEAVRELFNSLRRIFDAQLLQPLRVGDVVEVLLPQPEESDHR